MEKLKKMFRNDKEALKEINKIDEKLQDILCLLYNVLDETDYKIEDLLKAIEKLKRI